MAVVLGVNGVFHDPAAAIVVDGRTVAASEEERFSRRKHGKDPVPFSTWELPAAAAQWCLESAGVAPAELDAVAYSYEPGLALQAADPTASEWEALRTLFVQRAPRFLQTILPGLDPDRVRFVPHHVAHAASAYLLSPFPTSAVMVLDGRGEGGSSLLGVFRHGAFEELAAVALPDSMGLLYEEATEHLGFRRSSDEYKVMALAAYGRPRHLEKLRETVRVVPGGRFVTGSIDWSSFAPRRAATDDWDERHADLAASLQRVLEEVQLGLARWLHAVTGEQRLVMAGGVALNCVANTRLWADGPFDDIWIQPAAGDAGTALGAACFVANDLSDDIEPMTTAALGRSWSDDEVAAELRRAGVVFETPENLPETIADVLAADGIVALVEGRSEWGPRALGQRSLLANPTRAANLERLNDVKGREQFRPVAPMVLADRAGEIFTGPMPSPYMLFTHQVRPEWQDRIPAVVHVDGSARAQSVEPGDAPLMASILTAFERRTGVPVLVNTSLNTGGRPMVDSPRDALECFGSSPIDLMVIGGHVIWKSAAGAAARVA
ncbi:MAG: Carbamoyltransferase [Actinomycetia bacterium]|nr:Carbamoyltransferase [Actinomycetes bacterium]